MMGRATLLAVVGLALAAPAIAHPTGIDEQRTEMQVARAVRTLQSAFLRKYAALDAEGRQPALATGADWFPAYGFAPSVMGLNWSFQPLDTQRGVLCLTMSAATAARHAALSRAFSLAGLAPASSACQPQTGWSAPSAGTTVSARLELDRRDAPVATLLPASGGVSLSGVDGLAVTRPGLTLVAPAGQTGTASVLTVSNPMRWTHSDGSSCTAEDAAAPETDCTPLATSLVEVTARPGFAVTHTCTSVAAGATCTVSLTYTNAGERYRSMPLRLAFSTGEVATIGVLGRRAP